MNELIDVLLTAFVVWFAINLVSSSFDIEKTAENMSKQVKTIITAIHKGQK